MNTPVSSETARVSVSRTSILAVGSFALSLYFVIAVWNFWSSFINALGFNATIFILGFIVLFLTYYGITTWRNHAAWIIPIALIAISFSLWENPYLKIINILLLPFALSIAFNYALNRNRTFDPRFIALSILERISLLLKLRDAVRLIMGKLSTNRGKDRILAYKVILGLALFAVLALTVFIPLLSAVDPQFAELMGGVVDWFYRLLSFRYMGRIIFTVVATLLLISYFLSFEERFLETKQSSPKNNTIDSVVSGIVLGGVLLLYLVFLALQFSHLWVNELPFDFHQTEQLVKSGFWQLFILSIINIIFFLGYFKKTGSTVQNILKAFTVASLLLLVSAGHRMFLYAFFYGLSYEKFFASYTVIYCSFLFVWLAYQLFANRDSNLFKYLMFSLLWMYSIATILPVERIIFSFNENLSHKPDSRIKMNELQMLSYDALPLAAAYQDDADQQNSWCLWAKNQIQTVKAKQWYEKNLANFANVNLPANWAQGECASEASNNISSEPQPTIPQDDREIYNDDEFSFQVKYPDKDWQIIRSFNTEKNRSEGAYIYKDATTSVSILPLGNGRRAVHPNVQPLTFRMTGNLNAKKTVWELPDDKGVISIKLDSYPTTWNSHYIIEAKYTKNSKETVEKILESIALKEEEIYQ